MSTLERLAEIHLKDQFQASVDGAEVADKTLREELIEIRLKGEESTGEILKETRKAQEVFNATLKDLLGFYGDIEEFKE